MQCLSGHLSGERWKNRTAQDLCIRIGATSHVCGACLVDYTARDGHSDITCSPCLAGAMINNYDQQLAVFLFVSRARTQLGLIIYNLLECSVPIFLYWQQIGPFTSLHSDIKMVLYAEHILAYRCLGLLCETSESYLVCVATFCKPENEKY